MELNQDAIQAAVVDSLCERLLNDWNWKEDARSTISNKIDAIFKAEVGVVISETVAKSVQQGFDHEYRKADNLGLLKGEKTTVRSEIARLIANYWTEAVDRNGKPDAGSYGTKTTRAEWMMIQMCGEKFSAQMKQEVVNVTAGLKDGLRVQLRGEMDKMLNNLFKVKSTQDAAEKLYRSATPRQRVDDIGGVGCIDLESPHQRQRR